MKLFKEQLNKSLKEMKIVWNAKNTIKIKLVITTQSSILSLVEN